MRRLRGKFALSKARFGRVRFGALRVALTLAACRAGFAARQACGVALRRRHPAMPLYGTAIPSTASGTKPLQSNGTVSSWAIACTVAVGVA